MRIFAVFVALLVTAPSFALGDGVGGRRSGVRDGRLAGSWQKFNEWRRDMHDEHRLNPNSTIRHHAAAFHVHYHFHDGDSGQSAAGSQTCDCKPCPEAVQPAPAGVPNGSGLRLTAPTVAATPVILDGVELVMVVPTNDEYVGGSIRSSKKPFGEDTLRLMLKYIKPGSRVIDAGANLGTYTIFFANQVGSQGEVWAFEPQEYVHQVLTTNVVINGFRNVRVNHMGVSFQKGVAHMNGRLPDGSNMNQDFKDVHDANQPVNYGGRNIGTGGEAIQLTTIDSLNLTNVSLFKLDIQGAEPLAIYGARNTIQTNLPVVAFEVDHNFKLTQDMIHSLQIPPDVVDFSVSDYLKSLNYTMAHGQPTFGGGDQYWVPPNHPGIM